MSNVPMARVQHERPDAGEAQPIARSRRSAIAQHCFLILTLSVLPATVAKSAESGTDKPTRIIVPLSPGGTNDVFGRLLAEKMSAALGATVIVENRPGAATNIGTEYVVRSAPDGYTLLLGSTSSAANVTLYPKLPFALQRDFAPICLVANTSQVLVVHPSVPVRSVQDLINFARARPGQLAYASGGIAGPPHLAAALFSSMAKLELLHIPYKGGADAVTSILSGQTSLAFAGTASALAMIRAGRLRALGVTTTRRVEGAPDIPTIAESGLPGYAMSGWIALFAPARVSPDAIARLNRACVTALAAPDLRKRYADLGARAEASTPAETSSFVGAEIERYAKLIRAANIEAQ